MKGRVYKILKTTEWDAASCSGKIITDLDVKDGFIHLSTARQLAGTLCQFFETYEVVYLLELDMDKIDRSKCSYEGPIPNNTKRKGFFPHLYSALKTKQISNVWKLDRGAFNLPLEVILEAECN